MCCVYLNDLFVLLKLMYSTWPPLHHDYCGLYTILQPAT